MKSLRFQASNMIVFYARHWTGFYPEITDLISPNKHISLRSTQCLGYLAAVYLRLAQLRCFIDLKSPALSDA